MKKFGITSGIILSLLLLLLLLGTESPDHTPYFEAGYYKETSLRADSLKKHTTPVNDSILAGFARVSITPEIGRASCD